MQETKAFETLYKKSSKGDIEQWTVAVFPRSSAIHLSTDSDVHDDSAAMLVCHGKHGGKMQEDVRWINEGKNQGRSNETTPYEQALNQAESKWKKKKDTGYFVSKEEAENLTVLLPMLAHPYEKRKHNIIWPCLTQPKLDGIRCMAYKEGGDITLISRKGKLFPHLEHLKKALAWLPGHIVIDGELYSDSIPFERITGAVRRETIKNPEQQEDMEGIQLRVYDVYSKKNPETPFNKRQAWYEHYVNQQNDPMITVVPTDSCSDEEQMKRQHNEHVAAGYEGIMLRNVEGIYKLKDRSIDLQKFKEFIDSEYLITGFKQGDGKDKGTVIWTCSIDSGATFDVRPKGTQEQRRQWYQQGQAVVDAKTSLTVRYQELSDMGIPRFPVGISLRDYE
jgi:ATP-dependent DNA ligase